MSSDKLFAAVDEILCYIWDPIGVSADGTPQTRDEYTMYVPQIVDLLKNDAHTQAIADLLDDIEENQMGLNGYKNRNIRIANLLVDKHKFLSGRW